MIPSLLSALILGTARAADGADKIPRWVYVNICVIVVFYHTISSLSSIWSIYTDTAAWMWVLCVLTMLPPQSLFSAIHGEAPKRRDWNWYFLQRWSGINAKYVYKLSDDERKNFWYGFAMVYGAIRALLIIPAVIWLNEPWLMLAMLQGVLMWVCGKVSVKHAVMLHWFIVAGFIGAMI